MSTPLREAARIRRQTQRAALRPDAGAGAAETLHEIGTGQRGELHAEQRPARLAELAGVEELLHDLARGAAREGIALGREIRSGDGLADRGERIGDDIDALQPAADPAPGTDGDAGGGTGHAEHAEQVADAIHHRDGGAGIARPRLGHPLCDNALDIADLQPRCQRRRAAAAGAGRGLEAAAATTLQGSQRQGEEQGVAQRPGHGARFAAGLAGASFALASRW